MIYLRAVRGADFPAMCGLKWSQVRAQIIKVQEAVNLLASFYKSSELKNRPF